MTCDATCSYGTQHTNYFDKLLFPDAMNIIFLFLFGAIIGSFLNVCIARIPEHESIVKPGSHCPFCKTPIAWYDNIPLISYVLLGGRCRHCREPIAFRYLIVELVTPLLLVLLWWKFGVSPVLPIAFMFCAALVVITCIDLRYQIIPDVISIPGTVFFCAASVMVPWFEPSLMVAGIVLPGAAAKLVQSCIGILLGGGLLYGFALVYLLLTKREGMGLGDVKLLAMIGAFLGWKGALVSLMVGALTGSIGGILVMALKGKDMKYAIPFGPFLSLGALCSLLYGSEILSWYIGIGR